MGVFVRCHAGIVACLGGGFNTGKSFPGRKILLAWANKGERGAGRRRVARRPVPGSGRGARARTERGKTAGGKEV